MKKINFLAIFLSVCFLIPGFCLAEETKLKSLEGIEFFTGFGWGKLREKENYHLNPFMVDLDFNLKPLAQKIHFNPKGLLQFQIEPFLSLVSQPNLNLETGVAFFFKWGFLPQASRLQPYLKSGVGMVYITQHTREQSTQFNFIEQVGLGMHYFFKKNSAFTVELRTRHLSNAGMKRPNKGIDTYFVVAGISYQF